MLSKQGLEEYFKTTSLHDTFKDAIECLNASFEEADNDFVKEEIETAQAILTYLHSIKCENCVNDLSFQSDMTYFDNELGKWVNTL